MIFTIQLTLIKPKGSRIAHDSVIARLGIEKY